VEWAPRCLTTLSLPVVSPIIAPRLTRCLRLSNARLDLQCLFLVSCYGNINSAQAAAAAPQTLINAMTARSDELKHVTVCHLHTEGEAPYADPKLKDSFHVNSFFIGSNVRHTLKTGNGSYTPVFLSELPILFKRNIIDIDVTLIQVSPPDKHGYCSLGTTVMATLAAIENASHVIAQINPQMPRTHGDGIIHISELDSFVEVDEPIHAVKIPQITDIEDITDCLWLIH